MKDRTRRLELGKMVLDVAKYIFTIVVIGGLFYRQLSPLVAVVGIFLAVAASSIGFRVIPSEKEKL